MNYKTYYLPINSILLSNYLGQAIILPRKYLSDKIIDIQSQFEDYLCLTEKKWISGDNSNDCCVELVLTEIEVESLERFDNFSLLNNALPISRIKKIYFKNEEQKNKTIYNIEQGDGFVPDIVEIDESIDFINIKLNGIIKPKATNDIYNKSKRYNQLIGGIACMKLAGKISEKYNSNFSENYFALLGAINSIIKNDAEIANISTKSNIVNIFFPSNESNWDAEFLEILKSDPKSDNEFLYKLENYSKNHKNKELIFAVKTSLGVKWDLLSESDSYSIALAVLHRYGYGKRKNTTDLFNDLLSEKIPFSKKIESLLFIYGFHYGYSQFRNKEYIKNNKVSIKYLMNSKLDYFTIESIYLFSFYNKIGLEDFDYLTSWCPKLPYSKNNNIYVIDAPVYGLPLAQKGILQKIKEKIISFFLEGDQSKYSEKLNLMIEDEVSKKLEFILSDVNVLETENNTLKQQIIIKENDIKTLKQEKLVIESDKIELEKINRKLITENDNLLLKFDSMVNEEIKKKKLLPKDELIQESQSKYSQQVINEFNSVDKTSAVSKIKKTNKASKSSVKEPSIIKEQKKEKLDNKKNISGQQEIPL